MVDVTLDVAFWACDRTRALANGTVKIPNANATFHTAPIVTQIFEQVINGTFNLQAYLHRTNKLLFRLVARDRGLCLL